ncbi:hypothetical protein CC78DRAFT_548756 [Lojkania enalia]|uniref:Uncharacterized protein n=1 Tax=Lojkania enalia TaxID=147567 RepID=A0A9P4MVE7_9PLEO|nr:hypothetical protein CC78DRAFT_548756 [Didymosphaeria enalia]
MDIANIVAIVTLIVALFALFAAVVQVNIQASIEERRKGKTDKLALGEWAITWPQAKGIVFGIFSTLRIPLQFGDPRIITVPFITVGALEDCLRAEASKEKRGNIERRMKARLVESATRSIAIGSGRFTGRMYAVRNTTRKRSEACWSDAMDMCGITREYWPLLTGASALACDGAIRPANAVTNLHSLWGFARAMGLRVIEINGTRITMTNGGASIYLDQYAGIDRPTRLAHFSGSPNGRYNILEEMSQQTAESVYADAVWSDGCVPVPSRLEPNSPLGVLKETGKRRVAWPTSINPPILDDNCPPSKEMFSSWAMEFVTICNREQPKPGRVGYIELIKAREPAVISCIRTYPIKELSSEQKKACNEALLWCVDHWWRDPNQANNAHGRVETPRLPLPDVSYISSEFVTGRAQAARWCHTARALESVPVDMECWNNCCRYAKKASSGQYQANNTLSHGEQAVLVKFLQGWKLYNFTYKPYDGELARNQDTAGAASTICEILLVAMALLSIAMDSSQMGSSEVNKALEIELG